MKPFFTSLLRPYWFVIALCGLLTSLSYHAAAQIIITKTWTGSNDSNWANSSNWSPSGVPGSSDHVDIPDVTTNPVIQAGTSVTIMILMISHLNGSLTINANATLNVTGSSTFFGCMGIKGTLTNNGTLTVGQLSLNSGGISGQGGQITNSGNLKFNTPGLVQISSSLPPSFTLTNTSAGTVDLNGGSFGNGINGALRLINSGVFKAGNINLYVGSVVTNNSCGEIILSNSFDHNGGMTSNAGLVQVVNTLYGNFTNAANGVLLYGSYTGDGSSITFSDGSVRVNNNPTNSTIFTYSGTFPGTIDGIFRNSGATTSAGSFTAPNTFVPSGLPNGSQTLYAKITPSGGACNYIVPFTYNYVTLPTIAGFNTLDNTICVGSPITFTATIGNVTGAYDFTISNGSSTTNGNTSNTAFSQTLTASGSGTQTFTLTVSDNGASTTATTAVTVNALPTANILSPASTTLTCTTPILALTATGGSNYRWDDNSTSATRSVSTSGTYSVTVTNVSGCTAVDSQVVNSNTTPPTATITTTSSITTLDCNTTVLSLSASGGVTYLWSNGQTTATRTVNAASTYSVTVTGANGCTVIATKTISQNTTPPPVSLTATDVCVGKAVSLLATAGISSYTFVGSSGVIGTGGNTTTVAGLTAGIYSFTVLVTNSANSCTNSATASATVTALPTPTLIASNAAGVASNTLTCAQTSLTLTATDGIAYTFARTGGGGIVSQNQSAGTAVVNASGTYSVTVANAGGCTKTISLTLSSNTATIATTNPGATNGTVGAAFSRSFTASGGTAPRTFSLVSGTLPTGLSLSSAGVLSGTPTQAGTFPLVIRATDTNGCFDDGPTYNLTISALTPTITGFAASPNPICAGATTTFTATIGTITPPYSFTINNGSGNITTGTANSTAFSQSVTISGSGTQTFTLDVAKGGSFTTATTSVTVSTGTPPTVTASPSLTITNGNTVMLTASGASSYTWTGNIQSATFTASPTVTTTYAVTGVTGSCSSTTSVTVTVAAPVCYSVVYVTQNGAGLQNGSSWANSYPGTMLQTAINSAAACAGQVWVAAGTYKPTTGIDRDVSFAMRNSVAIYGGFVGSETALIGRPAVNPLTGNPSSSTLSGEIGDPGSTTDNSYHVISNPQGLTTTAILDGVVITGGKANGTFADGDGGGMYNSSSSPTITNCVFRINAANDEGGGMYNATSSPTITNCVFEQNNALYGGGGIINLNGSSPTITDCAFQSNTATRGGGFFTAGGSPIVTRCLFQSNWASDEGGAMHQSSGTPVFTSSVFQGNTANYVGVISQNGGNTRFVNCLFRQNHAVTAIGVIWVSNSGVSTTMVNCSFEGNTAGSSGIINTASGGEAVLTNCSFQNNSATTGTQVIVNSGLATLVNCVLWNNGSNPANTITGNPNLSVCLFPVGTTGFTNGGNNLTTSTSPFASTTGTQLNACAPAINTGLNSATGLTGITTDLAGNVRFFNNGIVDMGAYEFAGEGLPISFSLLGSGTATCASSPTLTLSDSETGVDYQLRRNGTNLGSTIAGTGAGLDFGTQPSSGTYTVLATRASNSCTVLMATSATVVSSTAVPTVSISTTSGTLTCALTSITLTATTSATALLWSNAATTNSIMVNTANTYSVTVTGANGCTATASTTVYSNTAVLTTTNPLTNTALAGTPFSQTFTASGGTSPYTYTLLSGSLPTGLTLSTAGVLSGTPTQTGTFTVVVRGTDSGGCFDDGPSYALTVSNPTPTIVGFAATSTSVCSGNIVTFTATVGNVTGNFAFSLVNGDGANSGTATSTFSHTLPVSGSSPQTITLIVSQGGQSQSATTTIAVNPLPSAFYTSGPSFTITQGNTLTITAVSPGNSFRWSTGATTATIINTPTAIGNALYSLTLTTPAGCTRVETLTNYWVIAPVCYSVVYVTVEGGGLQNGSSWVNAYPSTMLQTAINSATACSGQVWVKRGMYKPTSYTGAGSRSVPFLMLNNVAIYGGFAGTETTVTGPTGRTLTMPGSTTLSGNIDNDNTNTNNNYHVVAGGSLNSTARLDGVVITGGNADNSLSFANFGGGIFLHQSTPVLANCTLESNTAVYGGGICNFISSPSMTNCVLQNNRATADGGGLYSNSGLGLTLTNCVLQNNSAASSGGGLFSDSGRPLLTNCTLQGNSATAGAAIGITGTTYSLTLTNSIVWNKGGSGGANSFSVVSGTLVTN